MPEVDLGGDPAHPLWAASAQQLCTTNPHVPPLAGPPALVQWPATQGFVVGGMVGIPRWHARGQGFKSPQLHPRSTAQTGPDLLRITRLGQQIGSKLCCQADPVGSRASMVAEGHRDIWLPDGLPA